MTVIVAALAAGDVLADLLMDFTEQEQEVIWRYMGYDGPYPGPDSDLVRLILRQQAKREGWTIVVRRNLRKAMRRAVIARDIRALRLLLLLLNVPRAVLVAHLRGRDDGVMPRAGHGAAAPVRGSPFGWFAPTLFAGLGAPPG